VAALGARGDGGAQLRIAEDRRVAGAAAPQRLDCGLDDRRRRALVGIADGEEDDLAPASRCRTASKWIVQVPAPLPAMRSTSGERCTGRRSFLGSSERAS
jgi:hypothetical protein